MKKLFLLFSVLFVILSVGITSFAAFQDVLATAPYADAVNRVAQYGIIKGDDTGLFRPTKYLTREQFVKMMVMSMGHNVDNYSTTSSPFYDVETTRWSIPYIADAVKTGYIVGDGSGHFMPTKELSYAELCAVLVKSRTNIVPQGTWPTNYINEVKKTGLVDGITLNAKDKVPRWAIAVVFDKLLKSQAKNNNLDGIGADTSSSDYIILENSKTMETLPDNQILTDKGYVYSNDALKYDIGGRYTLGSYDSSVFKSSYILNTITKATVVSVEPGNKITYIDNNTGKTVSITLPFDTIYYYKGQKISLSTAYNSLKAYSSISFSNNYQNSSYEFAVITDPIYSKPAIVGEITGTTTKIGDIDITGITNVLRDDKFVNILSLVKYDVFYKVSDLWGNVKYYYASSDRVNGKILSILPNKLTAKSITIDSTNYEFSKYMDFKKISDINSQFNINDKVSVVMDYDGKIVDIIPYTANTKTESEVVIVGKPTQLAGTNSVMVPTDKGTLFGSVENTYNIGYKYRVVVDGDSITRVIGPVKQSISYYVNYVLAGTIYYDNGNTMTLPDGIKYYYRGSLITYAAAKTTVQQGYTLYFTKNDLGTGYDCITIVEP